jgi:CTP:phosphocholine cytidylyltransferase-like protein
VAVATELSYEAFELLQLLVRDGAQPCHKLPARLTMLNRPQISSALMALSKQGVIRRAASEIILRIPVEQARNILQPYRVQRAVILAAGASSRMRPVTDNLPKPMVTVGKKRLIETQLDALLDAGISDITIVRGYKGEAFDVLLSDYPSIKFIDSPAWRNSGAIVSAAQAVHLLANTYLIEGDLFIAGQNIIRPYEYRTTFCGVECTDSEQVNQDWFFLADSQRKISNLEFGNCAAIPAAQAYSHNNAYRFVGIMYWSERDAKQLAEDLPIVLRDSRYQQQFVESVPFDVVTGDYAIFARPLASSDAVEVDTYQELLRLRAQRRQSP